MVIVYILWVTMGIACNNTGHAHFGAMYKCSVNESSQFIIIITMWASLLVEACLMLSQSVFTC